MIQRGLIFAFAVLIVFEMADGAEPDLGLSIREKTSGEARGTLLLTLTNRSNHGVRVSRACLPWEDSYEAALSIRGFEVPPVEIGGLVPHGLREMKPSFFMGHIRDRETITLNAHQALEGEIVLARYLREFDQVIGRSDVLIVWLYIEMQTTGDGVPKASGATQHGLLHLPRSAKKE